jgi:PKD repeat protein
MIILLGASLLFGVTRHVPVDYATIQAAITACDNGDIVLVAPGIYSENINFQGKLITVTSDYSTNHNPQTILDTVISGTGTGSAVTFGMGEDSTAVLCGFSVTGGNYALGGGISVRNSSPHLQNLCLYNNTGSFAAGLYLQNTNAKVERLTICDNNGYGLRIASNSTVNVTSCIIYYNTQGLVNSSLTGTITFCDLQDEYEGVGNISTNPGFADQINHNYLLTAGSICKNTGSPFLPADPDGTRPDMGALFYQNDAATIYVDFSVVCDDMIADPTTTATFSSVIIPFNCTVASLLWNFGDNGTSSQANPTHTYEHGGHFTVSLTATSSQSNQFICQKDNLLTIYTKILNPYLSGTMVSALSPYYTDESLTVSASSILTIQPGVEINFAANCGLYINGYINAIGTVEDSICFQAYNQEPCLVISMVGAAVSHFQYCKFVRMEGIIISTNESAQTTIENCLNDYSRNCGTAVYGGSAIIRNSIIRRCLSENQGCGLNIQASNVLLENNQIYGNQGVALQLLMAPNLQTILKNNTIVSSSINYPAIWLYQCAATITGNDISGSFMGIDVASGSFARILNNRIHANRWGIYLDTVSQTDTTYIQGNLICNNQEDGICNYYSSAEISNNTIVNNNTQHIANSAGIFIAFDCDSHIVNNVIWGNTNDFARYEGNAMPEVSYNFTEFPLPAVVTDMGNNMHGNPGFISATDYRLNWDSPCVDMGNPAPTYYAFLQNDLQGLPRVYDGDNNGSAVIDIGCYEYNPGQANEDDVLPALMALQMSAYPNPFRGEIRFVVTSQRKGVISALICNIKGQTIRKIELEPGKALTWDGTDRAGNQVAPGIYLVKAEQANRQVCKKILRLK